MKLFKISIFIIFLFLTGKVIGQSADSIKVDIYEDVPTNPPLSFDLNNLSTPTLFILNNKKLKAKKFADLKLQNKNIEAISIIQDKEELKKIKLEEYNSVVIITTKK